MWYNELVTIRERQQHKYILYRKTNSLSYNPSHYTLRFKIQNNTSYNNIITITILSMLMFRYKK